MLLGFFYFVLFDQIKYFLNSSTFVDISLSVFEEVKPTPTENFVY